MLIDDLGDPGLEAFDPANRELRGEHSAQALMFGWVHAEQVACALRFLFGRGDVRCAWHDEARRPCVREVLVVGEHGLDVVVPGDDEDLHAERVDDGADPCVRTQFAQLGCRVECIAPHVDGGPAWSLGHAIDGTDEF